MATGASKAASPNTELGLKALYEALYEIRSKYASFGIQLGLEKSEIDDIEAQKGDPGRYLLEILSICLKRAKPLTWNDIYNALTSKCVNESKLAEEIRAKYLLVSDSSDESKSKQEHESEDKEDAVLTRKEKKELSTKGRRKGGKHAHDREKSDKERPKGKNKKERFMKDESQSEPEEVVREKSKRKKKVIHDKGESVKGYGDRDHYSDTEVCEKVRKRSKKHSKKREVYTESESEASSDEDEMENSSFKDDTSHKESAKRKLTKHKEAKIHPQKEHRKDGKKKDAKSRDIQYSDEEVSTTSAQKLRKSKKVETESEEELSSASSSDEEEIEVHKSTKKSKHTETKSAARTKDTSHYESEEKGKTSGKKRVSLKPKSATAKEASHYPEEYKDKGRKKAVRVDERVGKSTDSSRETYHKTKSKPPRKETEGRDGKRKVVSEKKATAPPLERDLPSSEMAQTDSGDGESDDSSEDENESKQQSSDEEEETENDSTAEENEEKRSEICKEKATHPTTEKGKTKSQDDENPRSVKGKKLSKAAGAPSKYDSHGDKEESDAGGSRDQEDQPKKRNRRRHRESSKVRGGSSPSSSQEERKPGSRGKKRNKRGREHKKKSDRKKKGKGHKDGASGIDDSSPECDMKNQSEVEMKELASVFERFYGKLCCVEFNPRNIAAQLQEKALISIPVMNEMLLSPESQQAMIISLIGALYEKIKYHPEHLFLCIEVMLKNDALQKAGKEILNEAGKNTRLLFLEHGLSIHFSFQQKCAQP